MHYPLVATDLLVNNLSGTAVDLNPRLCTANFITPTCRGGVMTPARFETKDSLVEEISGLLCTSTRDWWCVAFILGQYLAQLWGSKVKFSRIRQFFQFDISIFQKL